MRAGQIRRATSPEAKTKDDFIATRKHATAGEVFESQDDSPLDANTGSLSPDEQRKILEDDAAKAIKDVTDQVDSTATKVFSYGLPQQSLWSLRQSAGKARAAQKARGGASAATKLSQLSDEEFEAFEQFLERWYGPGTKLQVLLQPTADGKKRYLTTAVELLQARC